MDYYYICECGREWFLNESDVEGERYIYCSECGTEKAVDEIDERHPND